MPESAKFVPKSKGLPAVPPPPPDDFKLPLAPPPPPRGFTPPGTPGGMRPMPGAPSPVASVADRYGQSGGGGQQELMPGRLDMSGSGRPMPSMPGPPKFGPGGAPPPPPGLPGGGDRALVHHATQSLTDKLRASRVATAHPPGSAPGSRQPSSRGSGGPKPPPTPPPGKGTVAQTRNQARQQSAQKH
jgi:hypothetical protein